jgi:hypothetical protein
MEMDDNDKGHRFGNFPNYYAFHPPANRLQVLERTGILNYIRNGLLLVVSSLSSLHQCSYSSTDEERIEHRTKRIKDDEKNTTAINNYYYYCDLGCNSGELTMAMATSLLPTEHQQQLMQTNNDYSGGCNSNEYATRSTSGTTCNNNDTNITTTTTTIIKCLGLDLDPTLINRANEKFSPPYSSSSTGSSSTTSEQSNSGIMIESTFKVCNLCSENEHSNACSLFASENGINTSTTTSSTTSEDYGSGVAMSLIPVVVPQSPQPIFHVTTIFSTTMWIHIHSGDDGLHAFLTRACNYTQKYIIIEPQPSNCYRKANVRLRKMKRPELFNDTSSSSSKCLAMRNTIEAEIERIVLQSGFRRVLPSSLRIDCSSTSSTTTSNNQQVGAEVGAEVVHNNDIDKLNADDDITSWNRCIQLYERM